MAKTKKKRKLTFSRALLGVCFVGLAVSLSVSTLSKNQSITDNHSIIAIIGMAVIALLIWLDF